MCMDVVTNRKPRTSGVGWKVFCLNGNKLQGQIFKGKIRPRRRWLKEEDFREPWYTMVGIGLERYEAGWHIYTRKYQAIPGGMERAEVAKKVHYRKAICRGIQGGRIIVVAKEIWIC